MLSVKWLVLWSLWVARLVRQPTTPLRVSNGWLRGSVAPSGSHLAYAGIPYATITNRFQAPGAEPSWEGIFDAIKENIRCTQDIKIGSGINFGQEDCLVLNIYTPLNSSPSDLLPVMFYIHGGGFFEGSGSPVLYGPEYLLKKNVILVTINYRLNVQGFLCLGIKEAPGNAGLKDQVAALRWVQRNIRTFGGDPDNVTIFGESAGSASVSYHVLSPMSKGLFHKAIMQSGSSLASWALQHEPVHVAFLKAKLWGINSKDPYDLYNFFRGMKDSELTSKLVPRNDGDLILSLLIFLPCIEKHFDGVEPFLTEMPYEILSNGKFNQVPIMIGANTQEGLLFVDMEKNDYLPRIVIEKTLPKNLDFPSSEEKKQTAAIAKELYFDEKGISVETLDKLSEYVGEAFFNHPAVLETDLISQKSDKPVYSYVFSYDGWRNVPKLLGRKELRIVPGAGHADDVFYLFSQKIIPILFENKMVERMTTLWTNFAKYGNPTPSTSDLLPVKWSQASLNTTDQTLNIGQGFYTIPLLSKPSLVFWNNVYTKYRRKYTTYSA